MLHITLLAVLASSILTAEGKYAKNCRELLYQGHEISDVYSIKPEFSPEPFLVFCDMETRGGGWIYIINRVDGSQNFSLPWSDYKNGFGNLDGEFWLGLERIHVLTVEEVTELLVELVDWDLNKYQLHYKSFSVAGEEVDYRLQLVGGYDSADGGDSLTYNVGQKFSTIDRDNSRYNSCAANYNKAGWWFLWCSFALPTGSYLAKGETSAFGIRWSGIHEINSNISQMYSFKEARMMIRPRTSG